MPFPPKTLFSGKMRKYILVLFSLFSVHKVQIVEILLESLDHKGFSAVRILKYKYYISTSKIFYTDLLINMKEKQRQDTLHHNLKYARTLG